MGVRAFIDDTPDYHIVVRINADEVKHCSDEEVASRWLQILFLPNSKILDYSS